MFLRDDDMVECPYNKTHRMLRRRLQRHLHKCRLNYPDVELQKCPFNTTHLVPEPEFAHHATNCPDRKLITQYKYGAPEPKEEEVPKHAPIECDEDWDDTDVNDYNPQKYLENAPIIIKPDGDSASERKKFIKKERKRLGDGDGSSEDESKTFEGAHGISKSPNSYKRYENSDEDRDSMRSYRSKSKRCRRSRSPSSPYCSKQRSSCPDGYGKTYRDRSPTRRRLLDYLRRYSPPPNPMRHNLSFYNQDQDSSSYGGGFKRNPSNNSDKDGSNISMPEAPPPPMISYPSPRSYSTTKTPRSAFDY